MCSSDDPRDSRLRTSAALRFQDGDGQQRVLLLDVSPDHRAQALRARIDRCDGIFLTHGHVDHAFGLDEVRRYNVLMGGQAIDVYADQETHADLRRVFRHIFESHLNPNGSFVATLRQRPLAHGVSISIHGVEITPFAVEHGNSPVMAFRVDAASASASSLLPLVYCTDVSRVPDRSWQFMEGARTLVLDMLREQAHPTHLNLEQALSLAAQVGAQRTVFVHMAHDVEHKALSARLPAGVELGFDQLTLE